MARKPNERACSAFGAPPPRWRSRLYLERMRLQRSLHRSGRGDPESAPRRPVVVIMAPNPVHPGGITTVVEGWRDAGLGDAAELIDIWTGSWDDPVPLQVLQGARALVAFLGILLGRRADLVHLHVSTGGSLVRKTAFALLARLGRLPVIVHVHSGDFDRWLQQGRVRGGLARALTRSAALVVVPADRWRDSFERLGARRIEVVPNGLSARERAALGRVRERRAAVISPELPTVLYYGRWAAVKGTDLLTPALANLSRRDFQLRVFGNGDRGWLERALLPLGKSVTIGGWIGLEEKAAELEAASVLAVPSRAEGFGQVLLDGMAAGIPIVGTDAGAIPTVLDGYEPARIVPAGDAQALGAALAEFLWPEPEAVGRRASPFPPRFELEAGAEQLIGYYRELSRR